MAGAPAAGERPSASASSASEYGSSCSRRETDASSTGPVRQREGGGGDSACQLGTATGAGHRVTGPVRP